MGLAVAPDKPPDTAIRNTVIADFPRCVNVLAVPCLKADGGRRPNRIRTCGCRQVGCDRQRPPRPQDSVSRCIVATSDRTASTLFWKSARSCSVSSISTIFSTPPTPRMTGTPT